MATVGSMSERWFWLDWLRVLAIGLVFLYHSGMPFVVDSTWHITNSQPDLMISLFNLILSPLMPLLFVVSGISTYFSLSRRSPGQFTRDRFKRLMIPFIFVGLLFILSIHVYFDSVFHGTFVGSFQSFYFGPYFTRFFPFDIDFSLTYFANSNQGIYLWYVFWLFVFSVVTAHFFKWMTKQENHSRISRLATTTNRLGGIFLLAIPIIVINVIAVPPFFVFPSGYGGGKLPTYLAFFVIAYFLATDSRFGESIDKNKVLALVVGVGTHGFMLVWLATLGLEAVATTVPAHIIVSVFWALDGWSWMIAILGFGRKFLSFKHKLLGLLNELVLPFYVLHQTVIIAVAFFVVSLNLVPIGKYLIIILASFSIVTVLLLPVRQINAFRLLFGMGLKKEKIQSTSK